MRRGKAVLAAAVVAAVLAAVGGPWVSGQEKKDGEAHNPPAPLIVRSYDVRDLLAVVPDYTHVKSVRTITAINEETYAPARYASGIYGPPEESNHSRDEDDHVTISQSPAIRALTGTVKAMVDPGRWKGESGMMEGDQTPDLTVINGRLVVRQSQEAQAKIEALVRELREAGQAQLIVQGWWVLADEKELAALLAGEHKSDPRAVSPEALKAAKVLYSGRVSCYNGQRTFVMPGRATSAVLGLTPTVSENIAIMQPQMAMVHTGMVLETEAQLSQEKEKAHLNLWGIIGRPRAPMAPVEKDTLTHIDADIEHFRTTVTAPLGVPILTSGGSFGDEGKGLYLVIRVDSTAK